MADITHNDSVVTESKLTEFYNDIKPFLGCPAYLTSEGNAEYYSTEEKVIGRWIDGKPLYQRTLKYTGSSTVIDGTVGASLAGVSDIFVNEIKPTLSSLICFNAINNNYADSIYLFYPCNIQSTDGRVFGYSYWGQWTSDIYIADGTCFILKYTKTTDSAATTIQSDPNEYSTDEKIIGKWIDGKPIYQKTIITETPNKDTDKYVSLEASIDSVIDYNAMFNNIHTSVAGVNQWIKCASLGSTSASANGVVVHIFPNNATSGTENSIYIRHNVVGWGEKPIYITVQYTKTTD